MVAEEVFRRRWLNRWRHAIMVADAEAEVAAEAAPPPEVDAPQESVVAPGALLRVRSTHRRTMPRRRAAAHAPQPPHAPHTPHTPHTPRTPHAPHVPHTPHAPHMHHTPHVPAHAPHAARPPPPLVA
eukprot:5219707-Prymnesium_polylepis.1